MKVYLLSTIAFLTLIFSGCAQPVQSISQNKKYDTKHIIDKSYTIDVEQTAYIGESMIRVKDYNVIEKLSNKLKASEDFVFNDKLSYPKGEIFELEGRYLLDGKYYNVIKHPTLNFSRLLVDDEGVIHNKIINQILFGLQAGQYVTAIYTYEYRPTSIRLLNEKITETSVNQGNLNYELVYTGKDKDSLKLLYREYTSEDMARPSFYQTLTYDLKESKIIRFKNLKIEVLKASNEVIEYKALED